MHFYSRLRYSVQITLYTYLLMRIGLRLVFVDPNKGFAASATMYGSLTGVTAVGNTDTGETSTYVC